MLNISDNKTEDLLEKHQLYSLHTLKTPGMGRLLARVLMVVFFILVTSLFLPWQQNIRGTGKLTALNPENRPQTVNTTIAGRIADWKVREGEYVEAGDSLLVLTEIKEKYFDPQLMMRLGEQLEAKKRSLVAKEAKLAATKNQLSALQEGRRLKLQQTQTKLEQTLLKRESDSMAYVAQKINFANTENTFERNKRRFEAGNIPLTKFQELESKYEQSKAKLLSASNKYNQSKMEVANMRVELSAVDAEYQDKIAKTEGSISTTLSDLADSEAQIAKLQNEFANMEIRQEQYVIIAPQSGYVVKALRAGIGETIKETEAVVTIMPETNDKAAEIYIKAMDLPFISEGRKVRIEFDGWPALQFSGWPTVSVGTFGGEVKVIDRVESKPGTFRILVTPEEGEEPWPQKLRMGSGVKGWVMLDDVPIWYELWRQLNGFPPNIYNFAEDTPPKDAKKKK
ncbi:HlyD family secretion protein [Marinoscillum furvescens]|uniref:Multidrug resistance efflux pump n=1 Tax=Marinoscillum furvescens DSM 4134 TaxID=1122208 RepID=A0A3D9L5E8_MARFU|nr:HlyD family efflux transporter periplasmic adaptor subunit [Marinoscillum furvescens]RED99535.1 multidrug resistance efflux pump [Marinoscillum furvescens DSM 4134]